jgi:hypothetical protein
LNFFVYFVHFVVNPIVLKPPTSSGLAGTVRPRFLRVGIRPTALARSNPP